VNLLVSDIDDTLIVNDKPVLTMCQLYRSFTSPNWRLYFVTSRAAKLRQPTMRWLLDHCPVGELILMRPNDNWQPAPALKQELVRPLLRDYENIVAIDSREDVCAAYKQLGIKVLQCML
jgi:hypothetical protein